MLNFLTESFLAIATGADGIVGGTFAHELGVVAISSAGDGLRGGLLMVGLLLS